MFTLSSMHKDYFKMGSTIKQIVQWHRSYLGLEKLFALMSLALLGSKLALKFLHSVYSFIVVTIYFISNFQSCFCFFLQRGEWSSIIHTIYKLPFSFPNDITVLTLYSPFLYFTILFCKLPLLFLHCTMQ